MKLIRVIKSLLIAVGFCAAVYYALGVPSIPVDDGRQLYGVLASLFLLAPFVINSVGASFFGCYWIRLGVSFASLVAYHFFSRAAYPGQESVTPPKFLALQAAGALVLVILISVRSYSADHRAQEDGPPGDEHS